jgi:hypothetical protein
MIVSKAIARSDITFNMIIGFWNNIIHFCNARMFRNMMVIIMMDMFVINIPIFIALLLYHTKHAVIMVVRNNRYSYQH